MQEIYAQLTLKKAAIDRARESRNREAFNAAKESLHKYAERVVKPACPITYSQAQQVLNTTFPEGND